MRQLVVLATALFLISFLAPLGGASAPAEPSALLAPRERPHGDPFALADPAVWVPVLRETGDMQIAAAVAQNSLRMTYNLYPLGDANGDGKEDFLLVNETSEQTDRDYKTEAWVQGISGADYAPLWKVYVPDNSWWFVQGDVDGDKVHDLAVVKTTSTGSGTSQGQQGVRVSRYEYVYKQTYELMSGKDGAKLFDASCEQKSSNTYARASAAVVSASVQDWSVTSCYASEILSGSGMDLVTYTAWDERGPSVYAAVLGAAARPSTSTAKVVRLNPQGTVAWEWKATKDMLDVYATSGPDYTGDGVSDLLYSARPAYYGYVSTPVGYFDMPNPLSGEIGVVDGKTGKAAWTIPVGGQQYFSFAERGGSLRGPGTADSLVGEFHQPDGPHASWQMTIRQVNGQTGAVLNTKVMKDRIAALRGHSDLDGDGKSELLMMSAPASGAPLEEPQIDESKIELSVLKADYSPVWTVKLGEEDGFDDWFDEVDLDGDGVTELLVVHFPKDAEDGEHVYRFLSGKTGAPLWEYNLSNRVVSFDVIRDIDGTPGDDLAITIFDLPQPKSKSKGASSSSTAPPGPGPLPVGPSKSEETNYADHRGRLELRRGLDRELIWEKVIHDPSEVTNVTAQYVYANVQLIPDSNADGSPELLYNLETPMYFISERSDGFTLERQESGLLFALLISGDDGQTLKSYPESKQKSGAVFGKAARAQAVRAPSGGNASALAALPLLLVLAGLAVWRRPQA